MRITLIRHGKPDCLKKQWLSFAQFKEWIEAYKDVELDKNFVVPDSFEIFLSIDKVVFSSDLPRAVQTAKNLSSDLILDSLYREVEFSLPKIFIPLKLRPLMWMTLCRFIWFLGFNCQVESVRKTIMRAQEAADYLVSFAKKQNNVVLVGHGFFNFFIANELRKKGWIGPLIPNFGFFKGSSYRPRYMYPNNSANIPA